MGLEKAAEMASVPAGTSDKPRQWWIVAQDRQQEGGRQWLIVHCHQCCEADLSARGSRVNVLSLFLQWVLQLLFNMWSQENVPQKSNQEIRTWTVLFLLLCTSNWITGDAPGSLRTAWKWQEGVSDCSGEEPRQADCFWWVTSALGAAQDPVYLCHPESPALDWLTDSFIQFSLNAAFRIKLAKQQFKLFPIDFKCRHTDHGFLVLLLLILTYMMLRQFLGFKSFFPRFCIESSYIYMYICMCVHTCFCFHLLYFHLALFLSGSGSTKIKYNILPQ